MVEVGPRDGLQNQRQVISTESKIRLVDLLSKVGFGTIEVSSFVSARWVPQLADAAAVFAGITRRDGVVYSALTPNLKGFETALAAKAGEVAIFTSASEAFCQKNINCTIDESFERFAPIVEGAKKHDIPVRGYLSCVIRCPYSGDVTPDAAARVADRLYQIGCREISLGDTIGAGEPCSITKMTMAVCDYVPAAAVAGHFHDTNARALDNIEACLPLGIRAFDTAIAGLGGCPYAPGAKGNVSTLDTEKMLAGLGFDCGLDTARLEDADRFARSLVTQSARS
ncbi:hydroxymethylglutaryl-CoA lyase [Ruegeria sp. HKCCD8929]|uniref:hydroxymethylglutaryl-CoA lyase n=1 Tax=Ruegeria sp. HKCCD8929 TaxID=2683006 RepID=UPI001488971D|nr:hydroxymethylglutaryl-CoA lyase [Ruegeria sp. HKCCD8929]